jgi:hypothetical protein
LTTRLNGTTSRKEIVANYRKLSETEESTLSAWIIDTAKHGLHPQILTFQYLAQLLLSARIPSSTAYIGERWMRCFVDRHVELSSKYT